MNLNSYLASKSAEYAPFDPLRFPEIYQRFLAYFPPKKAKVIHIVGTNGKGSTGRFLSLMLRSSGASVGHFSSPHISEFRERFWINGALVGEETLERAHKELLDMGLFHEASYFEYATLLAVYLFKELDFWVIEAGLGGEFDSTSSLERDLSLFTSIGLDHQEILGEHIEDIAATKLRSMAKYAILGIQSDERVAKIAREIAKERGSTLEILEDSRENDLYVERYFAHYPMPQYQRYNFRLAHRAMEVLGIASNEIGALDLPGRFEQHGCVILDVGHNPLAARSLAQSLQGERVHLIYNSYKEKDVREILEILHPLIVGIHILRVENNERIMSQKELVKIAHALKIPTREFDGTLEEGAKYVVFGSFSVVADFKKRYGALLQKDKK
ncbi:MAG: bifunctional folylpolyglutamate synthase/dihydrofolate synthase [Wolinella sp.]